LGDFWVMGKLVTMMTKEEKAINPLREEILTAALTIYRFKSNEVIFRSVDTIKGIQALLKGDN